eukprot:c35401_g1_i1 orf=154-1965(+)
MAVAAAAHKALQESASALYRSVTPILERYGTFRRVEDFGPEAKRAAQQAENLKMQQEMFHRLLNLLCLFREGLATDQELASSRLEILGTIKSSHEDGEWAEFTRDKLVFLQELLLAGCISEDDYHDAKRPLILRLAKQGAQIYAQDVIFKKTNDNLGEATPTRASGEESSKLKSSPFQINRNDRIGKSKNSPIKQVKDAMLRLKSSTTKGGRDSSATPTEKEVSRTPHALDFLRPKNCPIRDPPSPPALQRSVEVCCKSPMFNSSDGAPFMESRTSSEAPGESTDPFSSFPLGLKLPIASSAEEPVSNLTLTSPSQLLFKSQGSAANRIKVMLTGIVEKLHGDCQKDSPQSPVSSDDIYSSSYSNDQQSDRSWGFELLRPPKKLQPDSASSEADYLTDHRILREVSNGQGPNTVKMKEKIHSDGASTDFFIDKILGENIKTELSRIRSEMNKTNSAQLFTNDQIDAIATRLPVDKSELKRFFPRAWCDRYGDVVLEVVRKEFKSHVGEMENLRKVAKDRRRTRAALEKSIDNDENTEAFPRMSIGKKPLSPAPHPGHVPVNQCFTATLDKKELLQAAAPVNSTEGRPGHSKDREIGRGHVFGS